MFCTRCKKDYPEGLKKCPDCDGELTGTPEETAEYRAMKPVKLITGDNSIQTEMIMNLLRNNDIPCFKKDNGPGGFMNVKYGFSVFGQEIYVDEGDYQKALDIINELSAGQDAGLSEEATGDSSDEDAIEEDSYKNHPFYKNPHILARIFLISQAVIMLLFYLLSKIIKQ